MTDQQLTSDHDVTIEEKSSQIKELLAEATGIIYEEPKATLPSRHTLPMTLEERLKVVFNLPSSEVLRGGKTLCMCIYFF